MTQHHAVKFFEHDENLCATVAGFIGDGLACGHPGLVIATAPHRLGILRELAARSVNADAAAPFGDLVIVDAGDTMARFMEEGRPDGDRFAQVIADLIDGLADGPGQRTVRAYGEMVDLLWQQGNLDATIELEHLWNRVASAYDLSLLCGYSMETVSGDVSALQRVCCLHSCVLAPSEVTSSPGSAS